MPNKEIKELAGLLNLDDPIEDMGKIYHRAARNIVFEGTVPNRRARLITGFSALNNTLLPGTGINKTICDIYDEVNKRILFLNFNSEGSHGIYCYNTISNTFQRLVEVGINTDGDPLEFTAESLININILYGDSTQGDILYWIDSLGRPSKININRALASGYGTIKRSYLDVAKEPASIPPYIVYENDSSNTVNNCRKKFFRAKSRWVFDDKDKSVTSSQSEMPIPLGAFDQGFDTDPTKNCRLAITVQTGPSNVKQIEILVSNSLGTQMSDFYLVVLLDKAQLGIPDNDVYTYLFYNDKAYTNIDINESNQLFDYVPQTAEAEAILNGNVLDYSNITEGYPNLTNFGDGTNTSKIVTGQCPYFYGHKFSNLIANQDGDSAFGSGAIHIVVRGIILSSNIFPFDTYTVYMTDGSNVSYTVQNNDDASAVIEGLRVDALSKGYTIGTVGTNDLYISKTGISLARTYISNSDYTLNTLAETAFPAYDWSSNDGFALVYFDEKERTNGAVYTNGFSVQASPYTEGTSPNDIPYFTASIYHLPPITATHYQWVRAKNLSKSKMIQWITDRTYKDLSALSGLVKYAYLSIESLNVFIANNPGTPLGYGFTAGDRVRFFKRYNSDGSTAYLYYNTKDFEIVASVINPIINGDPKVGQFVKIILPSTDGSFDFGAGFENYFVELYTPAQPVANNLNLYYEYGERYAIGNPGESNRFHQGMLQNQVYLSQAATFEFYKGDYWIKQRAIQTGNIYKWNLISGTLTSTNYFLFGMTFVGSTYATTGITGLSVPLAALTSSFNPSGDTRSFLNVTPNTTFKVAGSITLNFPTALTGDTWSIYIRNIFGDFYTLVASFDASDAGTHTFAIDSVTYLGNVSQSITLENDRVFLLAKSGIQGVFSSPTRNVTVISGELTFTIDHVITQQCIDPNFSDYYPSAVNSNGRAWIYDPNANRITYPTMHRWSMPYQEDTSINGTSRFYPENFDTVNRSHGPIKAMKVNGQQLVFFQERKCGQTGIFQKMITNNNGEQQLVTTNTIITQNNVQYYDGEFGVGNQATSIVQSGFVYYFIDPIKAKILRLSRDGVTDLTENLKVQTWGSQNLSKYLNPGTYKFGGNQKVLGAFNIRQDNVGEYLILAQGTEDVAGEIFAFEEKNNAFYGHHDIDCDDIICAENVLYAFNNGVLWKQVQNTAYAIFFGVSYPATITIPFNDQVAIKKVFNALAYMSDKTWVANVKGDVETNSVNSQTLIKQQSLIMEQDFDVLENPFRYAAFNRNMNSLTDENIALWEGEYLCGSWILVKLTYAGNLSSFIYAPYITWQPDPRNI